MHMKHLRVKVKNSKICKEISLKIQKHIGNTFQDF